jgi:hypothetical protein
MAAYNKAPKVGVRTTLAGRTDVHCLNTLSDFWPIGTLAAMKRLFMDSGGPSPPPVSHHCSSMLDRGFGTFASTPPATRLRTVGQARHRMSEVSSRGDAGGRMSLSSAPANEIAVCEPPTTDSNVLGLERVLFRGEPFLRQEERFIHNVVWSRQAGRLFPPRSDRTYKDSLLGSNPQQTGGPVVPGSNQGPRGSAAKASWLHRVVRLWEAFGRNETQATGSCGPARPGGGTHPSGPRQQGLLLRERPDREQGDPWPLAENQGPWGSAAKPTLHDWTRLT